MTPRETDNPGEILDLVDENDTVVGTISRRDIYANGLRDYRVVHAFIKNAAGQLWLPTRTAEKKLFPGALDYSVAGHVGSGESYESALLRESDEEVRLDLQTIPYRVLGKLSPHTDGVCAWQVIYEIAYEATPDFNQDDFEGSAWYAPADIVMLANDGVSMKSDLAAIIERYYL